VSFANCATYHM